PCSFSANVRQRHAPQPAVEASHHRIALARLSDRRPRDEGAVSGPPLLYIAFIDRPPAGTSVHAWRCLRRRRGTARRDRSRRSAKLAATTWTRRARTVAPMARNRSTAWTRRARMLAPIVRNRPARGGRVSPKERRVEADTPR